jgi:protein involved in polysaccharide export with SLBB domain
MTRHPFARLIASLCKARALALFLAVLVVLAPAALAQDDALKARLQYASSNYRLGPGDVLSVNVLHEPDYSQTDVLVRPDGHVSIVGVGEMDASNMTVGELTEEIRQGCCGPLSSRK